MADMEGIDLYADVDDFVRDHSENAHEADLYDDVITSRGDSGEELPKAPVQTTTVSSSTHVGGRKLNLYVGNLTWWTTDQDLQDALTSIGVTDLINIKFHENRTNGQSKGFATVTVGSENSSRLIFTKLIQKDLHGMLPSVSYYTTASLARLDPSAKKDVPPPGGPPRSSGLNRGSSGSGQSPLPPPLMPQSSPHGTRLPGPPPPGVSLGPPPFGPPPANGGPPPRQILPGLPPGRLPMNLGPPPGLGLPPAIVPAPSPREPAPMVVNMPPPARVSLVQPGGGGVILLDPRHPPPRNAVFRPETLVQPPLSGPGGVAFSGPPPLSVPPPGTMLHMAGGPPAPVHVIPGGLPPPGHPLPVSAPHINPAFVPAASSSALPPPGGAPPFAADPFVRAPPSSSYPPPLMDNHTHRPPPLMERSSGESYRRSSPERRESSASHLGEAEFEEILQRNKTVSSSAISRAVQDASSGDYGSAIETLVTAVSLIKQSKIANDDRCRILISSLQDTLHGIELKSYGSKSSSSRERRSRSPRERDPVERSSRSRQQRSRSREHEYGERHVDYVRERSHERSQERSREREREPAVVQERTRDRSRERDPYERSSRELTERSRVSSDSRRYESDRHRGSDREYSSSRSSRH